MINSVTVTNHLGESLTIEMANPDPSGLAIRSIEGLGPGKGTVSILERAGMDGALYTSARLNSRNIVISFIYLSYPYAQTARLKTYQYFPIKKKITLEIATTTRTVKIDGYVESNEPDIFSEQSGGTISIVCPDAYFYDVNDTVIDFSSVTPNFEFPVSNESLVVGLLEFGLLDNNTIANVLYGGDSEVGVVIEILASGPANNVSLVEYRSGNTLFIDSTILASYTGSDITTGDRIVISTVKGNKYAHLIRGGQTYNILNTLGYFPPWFLLYSGDNRYAYDADSGLANLTFRFSYSVAYEGV